MGHNLLPWIPTSARWQAVVGLVAADGSAAEVAAASARAAAREFDRAADDPRFVDAVHMLAALPATAARPDAVEALRRLGVTVGPSPSLPSLLGAVAAAVDTQAIGHSDFGELARRALVGSQARQIGDQLPGLLEPTGDEVLRATARLKQPRRFPALARDFFDRLVEETLANWLDRILPTQVGPDLRFQDLTARSAFVASLQRHVFETTRIIEEFSAGWYGKAASNGPGEAMPGLRFTMVTFGSPTMALVEVTVFF